MYGFNNPHRTYYSIPNTIEHTKCTNIPVPHLVAPLLRVTLRPTPNEPTIREIARLIARDPAWICPPTQKELLQIWLASTREQTAPLAVRNAKLPSSIRSYRYHTVTNLMLRGSADRFTIAFPFQGSVNDMLLSCKSAASIQQNWGDKAEPMGKLASQRFLLPATRLYNRQAENVL